jgi:hypothetical protein
MSRFSGPAGLLEPCLHGPENRDPWVATHDPYRNGIVAKSAILNSRLTHLPGALAMKIR